ncbi:5903_t:CDS:2, partial [Paraglomus occultum]
MAMTSKLQLYRRYRPANTSTIMEDRESTPELKNNPQDLMPVLELDYPAAQWNEPYLSTNLTADQIEEAAITDSEDSSAILGTIWDPIPSNFLDGMDQPTMTFLDWMDMNQTRQATKKVEDQNVWEILEYDFGEEIASSVNQKAYQGVQRQTPETAMTIATTPTESLHIPSGLEKMNNPTMIALSMEEIDQIVNTLSMRSNAMEGSLSTLLNKESPGSVSEQKKKKTGTNISGELESYKYLDLTTQTTPTMMMTMTAEVEDCPINPQSPTAHPIEKECPQNESLTSPRKYPADEIHLLEEENPWKTISNGRGEARTSEKRKRDGKEEKSASGGSMTAAAKMRVYRKKERERKGEKGKKWKKLWKETRKELDMEIMARGVKGVSKEMYYLVGKMLARYEKGKKDLMQHQIKTAKRIYLIYGEEEDLEDGTNIRKIARVGKLDLSKLARKEW